MKFAYLVPVLLVASACASAESLKATASKMGQKASAYLAKKDFAGFEKAMKGFITSDFKYIDEGKSMSFNDMLTGMKMGLGQLKVTGASSKTLTAKETGKTGVTTATHNISGTMTGPDHKSHTLKASATSTDTWVKVGGVWKLSVMNWGKTKMSMDGKPFDPTAAPRPAKMGAAAR